MRTKVGHARVPFAAICRCFARVHAEARVEIERDADAEVRATDHFATGDGAVTLWHGPFTVHLGSTICVYLASVADNSLAASSKEQGQRNE
jgi:hypothetical protein